MGILPRNRLLASTLTQLLNERRLSVGPTSQLAALSEKYNLDVSVIQSVLRYVNSPSAGETIIHRAEAKEDEHLTLTKAIWA